MAKDKLSAKFIIFSLVGVLNTLFDLFLYVILYNSSHSIILANTVSTSAAVLGSYFLNSRFTFKHMTWTKRRFINFVIVTMFGLWVLQTGIIYLISPLTKHIIRSILHISGAGHKSLIEILPKIIATVVTFVWNFFWYNKVVFKEESISDQINIALHES